jgi:CTP synthase (UTP-ammonia lyase)
MKVYVAPPKCTLEKVAFKEWLESNGFEPIWLDLKFKNINGPLILCGGADIGKRPDRDANEFKWIKLALDNKQPIIGVCRGMQILNLYFGGVVSDLDSIIIENHKSDDFSDDADHSHRISQFHKVLDLNNNTMNVNSRHHQYCSKIADNFTVTHTYSPATRYLKPLKITIKIYGQSSGILRGQNQQIMYIL